METKAKRLAYVDMVKGIATIEVICYHLLAPNSFKTGWINTLLTPLLLSFFIFSGYFYKPGKRTFAENVKSRTKSLLIPFVKYGVLFWLIGSVYLLCTKQATIIEALGCLRNFFGGCIWNRVIQTWFSWDYYKLGSRYLFLADFWFLPAMFFASLLFFPIADRTLHSWKKAAGASVLLLALTGILRSFKVDLPYNLQLIPFWAALMLLGALSRQVNLFELPVLSDWKGWCCAVISMAAGILLCRWGELALNLFRGFFPDPEALNMILITLSSILFSWGLGMICRLAEEAGLRVTELAWLGSNSMTFYLFHFFFAWVICVITGFSLRYPESVTSAIFWKSAAVTAGSTVLCWLRVIIGEKIEAKSKAE